MSDLRAVALSPQLAAAWSDLFVACESGCYCRYWHFTGAKNEWLLRLATHPEDNRDEQLARLDAGDGEARGIIAMEGDLAVGWMKLTPRSSVPKLAGLPVYRSLPLGDDGGVYSVGCLLVRPSHRGRGVARVLIEGASVIAARWGARTLEAYPRRGDGALRPDELWMGPLSLFEQCGFRPFSGEGPYPVLRKAL